MSAISNQLNSLQKALDDGYLIDVSLQPRSKMVVKLLSLLQRFRTILGYSDDLCSHVRVNKVADSLLEFFSKYENDFKNEASAANHLKSILTTLNTKTNQKYDDSINDTLSKIAAVEKKWSSPFKTPVAANADRTSDQLCSHTWTLKIATRLGLQDNYQLFQEILGKIENANQHKGTVEFLKPSKGQQTLKITTQESEETFKIPCSMAFAKTETEERHHSYFFSKIVIAKGGERKVKLCYDATTKQYCVRKKISDGEQAVLEYIKDNPSRGLPPSLFFKGKDPNNPKPKAQVVEPLYKGTLETILPHLKTSQLQQKIDLMLDLLTGLNALHSLIVKHPIRSIDSDGEEKTSVIEFPLFHTDIKPSNILIKKNSSGFEAVLSDFGYCNNPYFSGGSPAYLSPESYQFRQKKTLIKIQDDQRKATLDHNIKFGQGSDCWSLGLVFVVIMTSQLEKETEAPILTSLQQCLDKATTEAAQKTINEISSKKPDSAFKKAVTQYIQALINNTTSKTASLGLTKDEKEEIHLLINTSMRELGGDKIAALTQKQIDTDLQKLRSGHAQTAAERSIWDLIGEMLQVNPSRRITSVKALQKLNTLNIS